MIHLTLNAVHWGTDEVEQGVQINLKDPDSGIVVVVPFTGEPLVTLINEMIEKMPPQLRDNVKLERGGLVTATSDELRRVIDNPQA